MFDTNQSVHSTSHLVRSITVQNAPNEIYLRLLDTHTKNYFVVDDGIAEIQLVFEDYYPALKEFIERVEKNIEEVSVEEHTIKALKVELERIDNIAKEGR